MKFYFYKKIICLLLVAAITQSVKAQDAAPLENILFPADAGIINVTSAPYNADNTGVADATAALQAAIDVAKGNLKGKIVYLPNGIYKVSNKLVFSTDAANHRGMIFQGQSREGTIIKLADNTATNAAVLFPVIKCVDGPTFHNSMFNCNILNMTIDVGVGNPGAVGINFLGNNQSCIRNVLVKSSDPGKVGRNGLEFSFSLQGPSLIKNVTVDGFNYGIRSRLLQYGLTFENITLKNQNLAGIYNDAQTLSIRKLLSQNTVPAIQQTNVGQSKGIITLIDSRLENGDAATNAIQLDDGFLFARNVQTTGYASALRAFGTAVAGANIDEYVSHPSSSVFPSFTRTLNIPIRETPELPLEDPSLWVSVGAYGAIPGDAVNDDAAIQAAMNSGAATIYFPNPNNSEAGSRYRISTTITIPATVKRILGLYVGMYPVAPINGQNLPLFKFVGSTNDVVIMEGVRTAAALSKSHLIEQASSRTLVLRNISVRNGWGYRNTAFGDVYMEDFHTLAANVAYNSVDQQPGCIFKNQNVWARQLNPEQNSINIVNDGSRVWILGFKSEYPTTLIETKNGGRTEVLGGLHLTKAAASVPAFVTIESSISVAGFGEARSRTTDAVYTSNIIAETRGGTTAYLQPSALPTRKAEQDATLSFVMPLYIGYDNITLPVNLLSFKAQLISFAEKQVKLDWTTANEINIASYVVERSSGNLFTAIGTVIANNTAGNQSYSFTDAKPLTGTSYYRLKLIDKDGKFKYSEIRTIKNSNEISLGLSPNPATTKIDVFYLKAKEGAVLTVVNMSGQVQLMKAVPVGSMQMADVDVSGLAKGYYIITVQNGDEKITGNFIKQ